MTVSWGPPFRAPHNNGTHTAWRRGEERIDAPQEARQEPGVHALPA